MMLRAEVMSAAMAARRSALRREMSPRRLVGHLAALAGLVDPGTEITPAELARSFSWSRLPATPAIRL